MDNVEKDVPRTPPPKRRRVDDKALTPPPVKFPEPKHNEELSTRRLLALLRAVFSDDESDAETLLLGQQ